MMIVAIALGTYRDLHRCTFAMLCNLRKRGKKNIHRVVLKHLGSFEREHRIRMERRVRRRVLSLVVKDIVIAAALGNACIGEDARDEPLCKTLFLHWNGQVEKVFFGSLWYREL